MINLNTCSEDDVRQFGRYLLNNLRDSMQTFEQVSRACSRAIYDEFRASDGEPLFALVRVFRSTLYENLPPELQTMAHPDEADRWLTLMGTMGVEPAWRDRRQSQNHQVVPVNETLTPMFTVAFEQLGIPVLADASQKPDAHNVMSMVRYFHTLHAPGSPLVPAQDDFVEPYGIESVVGVGGRFLSGATYVALGFSIEPIDEEGAQKFGELAPHLSTLLAIYDGQGAIWND